MTNFVRGSLIITLTIVSGSVDAARQIDSSDNLARPKIEKRGTIDLDLVETQPIVFRGQRYRFESVRTRYEGNQTGKPYFQFVDPASGKATPGFAEGHDLGSVHVEGETLYVFGTPGWGSPAIDLFWSKDLKTWQSKRILDLPNWKLYNCSVCKAGERYVMAFEVGGPPEVVGAGFTNRFAESNDLLNWKLLDEPAVFTKERYSACPTIRYEDGWFYVVYLESMGNSKYNPSIVRSRDLAIWESSPLNPIMRFDETDKRIANPRLTVAQQQTIAKALNRNISDVDFCDHNGQVIINYSWGDQVGHEFLAEAVYAGSLKELLTGFFPLGSGSLKETPEQHDQRMAWWRDARFGMFIHWGLYSAAAGKWAGNPVDGLSSWTQRTAKSPLGEYTKLRDGFTASKFDADAYAKLAQEAGMKYLVLVSKHHEGFCLWDSVTSDYDIGSTSYQGDLVRELAEACARRDIRFGVYYSILDWHHPDYSPRLPWDKRPRKPEFGRYINFMKAQLKELLEVAPNIDILWFDGEWDDSWTHTHGKELDAYVRSLKPSILINNRVDKGRSGMGGLTRAGDYAGDFGTPEQQIPPTGLAGVDWETCMTINDTWGYKRQDSAWKSTDVLLHQLIDCASKGGNYLLNIGPMADGTIPAPCPQKLRAVGSWLSCNGEAIYGTTASPFSSQLSWGRCTTGKLSDGVTPLYLHVLQWPADGKLTVPPLENVVQSACLLADEQRTPLSLGRSNGSSIVTLGDKPSSESAIVVVLQVEGKPKPVSVQAQPQANGEEERKPVTLYVSKLGDDSDGASWQTAFHTIQSALDAVPDGKGGHRVLVRPDTYMEANMLPAHRGAKGAYNQLIGDFDGSLGSGTTGHVVFDAGDPSKGFKSYDWWGNIRAYQKGWSAEHTKKTVSAIKWDRWILRRVYATGGDAGFFFDCTDKIEPFSVIVEDCISIGRAFGCGVASCLSRSDEPITFRRCNMWSLDEWGDTSAGYVRIENESMPEKPDIVFEDCTMVSPQCALKGGNYGFHTYTHALVKNCTLVALNFSQPHGTPTDGVIQSVQNGKYFHVDFENSVVMGFKVFGVKVDKDSAGDIGYTTKGSALAYVQYTQQVPKGFHTLDRWPVEAFAKIAPPAPAKPTPVLANSELILSDMCEISPFVWKGRLCRMECYRPGRGGAKEDYYLLLRDEETDDELARFAVGYGLASCHVDRGVFYAFASRFEENNWNDVTQFKSHDLKNWQQKVVLKQDNEHLFNSSVCAGPDGFTLAYESNDPTYPGFTTKFARSDDLETWSKLPDAIFGTNRYTACPTIRYVNGYYYVLYLEHRRPSHVFETYVTRSKDLLTWELSSANPVIAPTGLDEGINTSDADVVEFDGKTFLYYAVGDQLTWMNVKRAQFNGTLQKYYEQWYSQPGIRDRGVVIR
ncbi:MAG: alpha-L-fucosidase [Pirellulales bacterium]